MTVPGLVMPPAEKAKTNPLLQHTLGPAGETGNIHPLDLKVLQVVKTIQAPGETGLNWERQYQGCMGTPVSPIHFQTYEIILVGHSNSLEHGLSQTLNTCTIHMRHQHISV